MAGTTSNRMKKAQVEIMGVAIIVLLVSIAFLFVISFQARSSSRADKSPQATYGMEQLSTNFLAASLQTSACQKHTVEDLVVACAKGTKQGCLTEDPCMEANETLEALLTRTLDTWEIGYQFMISYPGNRQVLINTSCPDAAEKYRKAEFFIPLYEVGQSASMSLHICR